MARGAPGEEVYTPQVQPEDLPRKIVPRMEVVPTGQAFAGALDASAQKYNSDSATWAGDQLAQARVKAVNDLETAKQNAPPGDQTGFTEKYLAGFDKDTTPLLQSAGSNTVASQMLNKGLTDLRQTLYTHTQQWVAGQNVAYRKDSVVNNTDAQLAAITAHPEIKDQVASTLFDQIRTVGGGNETMLPLMRMVHEKTSQAAADGLTRQNPQGVYDALNNPENAPPAIKGVLNDLSDPQREALRSKVSAQISGGIANNVVDTYRAQGPSAGAQAMAAVDKLNQPDEIKTQIRADIERGIDQWHAEARQTHAQDIIGLEERLGSGKINPDDRAVTLGLFRNGTLTAQQTGETIGRIEKAQEKKVDDDAIFHYAQASYQNATPLDPKDEHIRKAMDAVFTEATNHVQPGSPEWINRAADIGAKTGVTPDSAISWARTQLTSGSAPQAAQAAQALQRITDANPRGTPFALDDKDKASARLINDAVHAGTDPIVAVQNARQITSMPDADKQRLEEIYKQKQLGSKSQGDLTTQLKDPDNGFRAHFWNGIPDVPPQMTGQFEELRSNYFKLTGGNVDQANKLATQDLKNTWGITNVNGTKEFMQFAPEAMNPGLTTEAVRADLEASAKGHTDDPSKVRLLTTPDTYQSNGQRWGLGVPDKFGAYSALTDEKGRVIPYQLPTGTQALKDQAAKEAAAGMAKLHEAQAIERAREKNELGEVQLAGRQQPNF